MLRYIYLPTGAEVTAPEGLALPPHLFEPASDKPKPQRAEEASNGKPKPKHTRKKVVKEV